MKGWCWCWGDGRRHLFVDSVDFPEGDRAVVGLDSLPAAGDGVVVVPLVGVNSAKTALAVKVWNMVVFIFQKINGMKIQISNCRDCSGTSGLTWIFMFATHNLFYFSIQIWSYIHNVFCFQVRPICQKCFCTYLYRVKILGPGWFHWLEIRPLWRGKKGNR